MDQITVEREHAAAEARRLPQDHPPLPPAKIGVLLLNLGTPDDTSYWPMRRYLKEFLSDRRVIDINPLIWKPLLNLVILSKRPFSSGRAYASIWNTELDESPLRTITRAQADKLRAALGAALPDAPLAVEWGMRYGNPSTAAGIEALVARGCTRLLLLALYPQYSATTTATAYDKAFEALMRVRWQPAVRTAPPYFEHPAYIDALARSVRAAYARLEREPELLVTSYHGLPQRYLMLGDPYHCQCHKTTRLLRERLGWPEERVKVTFQSRFGSEEWLKPYTADTMAELAEAGLKRVAVMAPGFAADCVETLEEIREEIRDAFVEAGGEEFTYIPCLNDGDDHVTLLAEVVRRELSGWL